MNKSQQVAVVQAVIEHAYRRAIDNIQVVRHEAQSLAHLPDGLGDSDVKLALDDLTGRLTEALHAAETAVTAARDDMRKRLTVLSAKAHGVSVSLDDLSK